MPDRGTFVVGTGRCGSTLLSDLLALHPSMVAIQELMVTVQPDGLGTHTMSGVDFWRVLSRPSEQVATLRRIGVQPPELRYRGEKAEIPRLLAFALPALTDDPDRLFDELAKLVPEFPDQPLPAHYRMLFAILADRTESSRWVERSGGSSGFAPALVRMFPDATYVYLTRDCVDTAVSMARHPGFQLAEVRAMFLRRCGVDPYRPGAGPFRRPLPEDLRPVLPDELTASALAARGGTLTNFVLMWTFLSRRAEAAFAALPPERVVRLRYEDLVAAPLPTLTGLAAALDLPDGPAWAARAAARVRRPRPGLAPDDPLRAELTELADRVGRP